MDEPLHCLVEIPKGSRNKNEWDDAIYKQPEGKDVTVDGWYERDVALQVIEESRARWRETRS
jgi:inorganic pyrophosphatase